MDETTVTTTGRMRKRAAAVGLIAAGVVAGGILASTVGASAATNGSDTTTATPGAPSGSTMPPPMGMPGGPKPVRSDESSVSGDTAATLKAAALKAVPGGTVYRVESDAGDGSYEAHMTKADGSPVTVKFDKSLAVTTVEPGMGTGDPAMPGQPTGSSPATTG